MGPGEIKIKDADILIGLMERRFSPLLVQIIVRLARKYGLVIAESYRPKKHRTDLHGTLPVRAIDCEDCYENSSEIKNDINRQWEYDSTRPEKKCAEIHNTHLHIQVSPETRRRAV